jgi:hypothetical protein
VKTILCSILVLGILLTPSASTAVVYYEERNLPVFAVPFQQASDSGNVSNISIENIDGGVGITLDVRNSGGVDLSNITISITLSNTSLVKLQTTHIILPFLAKTDVSTIRLRLFGLAVGILTPLPKCTVIARTSEGVHSEVQLTTMVLGPFTILTNINYVGAAFNGYTLFSPEYMRKTFLIDKQGTIVHTWDSRYIQGLGTFLLENGDLLRTMLPYDNPVFMGGGMTGGVERFDWNGSLLWEFTYSDTHHCLHHNIKVLPNGHILMVGWEYKTAQEAIAAGRDPDCLEQGELWPDHVIEVEPTGQSGGTIVWEWHIWDHLIQDFDPTKENYGSVGQHPELLDINYGADEGKYTADWNHINAIDYNDQFDQILLSPHNQNEVWVIDHGTTTEEAAGHTGGRSGKGGDLLYRYGNPRTYRAGQSDDQIFFGQHDAQWIPPGCPGEGNILVFNNGQGRPEGRYSSVDELIPPVDDQGTYLKEPDAAYGPETLTWSYTADNPVDFYAGYLSGTQRLPNGNTLICDGDHGVFFEVTSEKKTVWEYRNTLPYPLTNQVFKVLCYPPDYPGLRYFK